MHGRAASAPWSGASVATGIGGRSGMKSTVTGRSSAATVPADGLAVDSVSATLSQPSWVRWVIAARRVNCSLAASALVPVESRAS